MVYLPDNLDGFRWRRSMLFLPASNARAIEKARTLEADCLIFDLEDAVAPSDRPRAIHNLKALVAGTGFGKSEILLRLPAFRDENFEEAFIAATEVVPDGIVLPKVETANEITNMSDRLIAANCQIGLWAMIETPLGIVQLKEICSAGSGMIGLIVGPNDLAKATGVSLDDKRAALVPWLMQIVLFARAYGLYAIDGVYNHLRDSDGFLQECSQGAAMGFEGKTLIHPNQIELANRCYGPKHEELEWAQTVVTAFAMPENSDKGVIEIKGKMVERLHLEMAERLMTAAQKLDPNRP